VNLDKALQAPRTLNAPPSLNFIFLLTGYLLEILTFKKYFISITNHLIYTARCQDWCIYRYYLTACITVM
jgi:hypothetical protein